LESSTDAMFSRISQLSKNITEEIEQVVNAGHKSPSSRAQGSEQAHHGPTKLLEKNAHLLESQTPEPSSMEIESEVATREGTPTPDQETSGVGDDTKTANGSQDEVELPREVIQKLKKFAKYEEKYPRMLFSPLIGCSKLMRKNC
jgi:hypothetical protein